MMGMRALNAMPLPSAKFVVVDAQVVAGAVKVHGTPTANCRSVPDTPMDAGTREVPVR